MSSLRRSEIRGCSQTPAVRNDPRESRKDVAANFVKNGTPRARRNSLKRAGNFTENQGPTENMRAARRKRTKAVQVFALSGTRTRATPALSACITFIMRRSANASHGCTGKHTDAGCTANCKTHFEFIPNANKYQTSF